MSSFNMKNQSETFSRYLPPDSKSEKWGFRLIDAGRQNISPGADYPFHMHPLTYLFEPSGKRTLKEFQIVTITSGSGSFESSSLKKTRVTAGDTFLLFPGEWHRYRPSLKTGWSEYWLGFEGSDAERIMKSFFNPSMSLYRGSYTGELIKLFDQLLYWLRNPQPGSEQILASHIPMLLALLRAGSLTPPHTGINEDQIVLEGKAKLLQNIAQKTDLEKLANEIGVSYSSFRSLFRKHTGYSPRAFENLIKLNRSKDMLLSGNENVSTTAEALGYTSVHYFSRAFKKHFGQSPHNWLKEKLPDVS